MRLLVGVALLSCASAAYADWVEIGGPNGGGTWYMDASRIKKDGSRVHVWVKVDASQDRTVKYRSEMLQYSLICGSEKIRLLSAVQYDSYGKVINSNSVSDSTYSDYGYSPVTPESMGEVVLRIGCAVAEKQ